MAAKFYEQLHIQSGKEETTVILNEMATTIENLVIKDKGILAADESVKTIGKRFNAINVENTPENRRQYRSLLCTTNDLNKYISGVILFEETLLQNNDAGKLIPEILHAQNIVTGIKVDKGLATIHANSNEKITQGLDGLSERLKEYKNQGARFAKWRNVYNINQDLPSQAGLSANAHILARYAAICQSIGIVPIVEPELLMDGNHSLETCARVSENILKHVFAALVEQQVILEYMLLKPNMILAGNQSGISSNPTEVAHATIKVLRRTVPAAVPSINFLSGGQSSQQATNNLNMINSIQPQPWQLSFSFGRALQEHCLQAWQGEAKLIPAAQQALLVRARLNSHAVLGEYQATMEENTLEVGTHI